MLPVTVINSRWHRPDSFKRLRRDWTTTFDREIVAARWYDATGESASAANPDVFLAFWAILEAGEVEAAYEFVEGVR